MEYAGEQDPAAEGRQPGRDERALGERSAAGVQRSRRPADRAQHDHECPQPVDGAIPNGSKRNARPTNPRAIPDVGRELQPTAEGDAIDERHPDRDRPDEEGSDPGWNRLLRPGKRAVSRDEEEASEDEARRRSACRPIRSCSWSPRGSAKASRTPPATRCRIDIARNGGRSRTTIASAMNVEPQARYTVPRASQTRAPCRADIRPASPGGRNQLKSTFAARRSAFLIVSRSGALRMRQLCDDHGRPR